jgi:hypothetical protein
VNGTIALATAPDTNATVDLTVTVNGGVFARITGTTKTSITVAHADGSPLSPAELQALSDLFGLPDALELAINDLFHPVEHFLGI